jgi:hypothetical protein
MVTMYRTMTDGELCRQAMSQDTTPLERELAQRLERMMYHTDKEETENVDERQQRFWA